MARVLQCLAAMARSKRTADCRPRWAAFILAGSFIAPVGCDLDEQFSVARGVTLGSDEGSAAPRAEHRRPGSLAAALLEAAHEGDVDDDEAQSLAALRSMGHELGRERYEAGEGLRTQLAQGAPDCVFDTDAAVTEIVAFAHEEGEVDAELLDALHETLSAEQRAAAIERVQADQPDQPDQPGPKGDGPPPTDGSTTPPPPPPRKQEGGPGDGLLDALELSEGQVDAVERAMEVAQPHQPQPAARPQPSAGPSELLAAFEGEDFSSAAWSLEHSAAQRASSRAAELVALVSAVCAELDEAQLATLVQALAEPDPTLPPPRRAG